MNYVLRGKIVNANPYQLDKTLTVEGAGAEAKATGEAIAKAKTEAKEYTDTHANKQDNPHKVTKEQVGLGNVDNTSDKNKPVSTAQAEAIADAKKAGIDAQEIANSKAAMATTTTTLAAANWSSNAQTVSVEGVTANGTVIVTPAPGSYTAAVEAGLYCSAQGDGTLSFACTTTPTVAIEYNILILT